MVPTGPARPSCPVWPHSRGCSVSQLPAGSGQGSQRGAHGVAAPGNPAPTNLESPRSSSHRKQEKHSQGRAMGKGPPRDTPSPAAASRPSLASPSARARRWLHLPEERCWAKAGLPNLREGVHEVARVPGCAGRGRGRMGMHGEGCGVLGG